MNHKNRINKVISEEAFRNFLTHSYLPDELDPDLYPCGYPNPPKRDPKSCPSKELTVQTTKKGGYFYVMCSCGMKNMVFPPRRTSGYTCKYCREPYHLKIVKAGRYYKQLHTLRNVIRLINDPDELVVSTECFKHAVSAYTYIDGKLAPCIVPSPEAMEKFLRRIRIYDTSDYEGFMFVESETLVKYSLYNSILEIYKTHL